MTATGFGVVYFSSIDWDFRTQDQQFLALALASAGHPVVYVENTGARVPGLRDLRRIKSRLARAIRPSTHEGMLPGIRVVSPLVIPGGASWPERVVNRAALRRALQPHVRALGRPLVLWVSLPNWCAVDLARDLDPDVLVYYCGDAFAEVPGIRSSIRGSEARVVSEADLVFATSASLAAHCEALGGEPTRLPVVIDLAASAAARRGDTPIPPELRTIHGRIIGYMGGLNHKVDPRLLNAVAEAFPNDTLVVLGSVEDSAFQPRPGRNVVILGERPYAQISAYLTRFDVCLIPYVVNEFTAGVYPAKLLEYLAVGRPVVSTPLPEVQPFADLIRLAGSAEEFVEAVRGALADPGSAQDREARVAAVVAVMRDASRMMFDHLERAVARARVR